MNNSISANFEPHFRATGIEAIILLLANVMLAEEGLSPNRDVRVARRLLNEVFDEKKIACIKFVREQTGLGLKDAKEFCEDHFWQARTQDYSKAVIHRMQDRRNLRY